MSVVIHLLVILGLATLLHAQSDSDAVVREAIRAAYSHRSTSIESFEVITRITQRRGGDSKNSGSYMMTQLRVMKPGHWYLDSGHGAAGIEWLQDLARNRTYLSGHEFCEFWPNQMAIERVRLANQVLPQRLREHPFFLLSGWWPEWCGWPCPGIWGNSVDVGAVAQDDGYVLGRWGSGDYLWALRKGNVDCIVLDSRKGYAMVRRELTDVDGPRRLVVETESLRARAPGLWVPSVATMRLMNKSHSGVEQNATIKCEVRFLRTNGLSEGQFAFNAPAGTYRISHTDSEKWGQVAPGGLDLLRNTGKQLVQARPQPGSALRVMLSVVVGAAGAALGVVLCVVVFGMCLGRRQE